MGLNERISKIIEYSKLSSSEFADEISVQRSSISHITSGRNKPSLDFLTKIKDRFPELEWEWLIEGKGEMIKEQAKENLDKKTTHSLPNLFSLINDDNFGKSDNLSQDEEKKEISNSQPLEVNISESNTEDTENEKDKIKRIIIFFESGKFESYE